MLMNIRLCKVLLPLALFLPSTARSLAFESFQNGTELKSAVDAYLEDSSNSSKVALKYGWPIGTWLVENVADFSSLFHTQRNNMTSTFNEPLEEWNTSKATTMEFMFAGAEAYNQDLSMWDVSKVTSFFNMFTSAKNFNQDLCDWGPKLDVGAFWFGPLMFFGTSCPNKTNPNLRRIPIGPLCYNCFAAPTASPAPTVTDSPTNQPTTKPTPRPIRTCKKEGVTNREGCREKCKEVYPSSTGIQVRIANGNVFCSCTFGTAGNFEVLCTDGPGSAGAMLQKGLTNLIVGASVIIWMVLG